MGSRANSVLRILGGQWAYNATTLLHSSIPRRTLCAIQEIRTLPESYSIRRCEVNKGKDSMDEVASKGLVPESQPSKRMLEFINNIGKAAKKTVIRVRIKGHNEVEEERRLYG